MKSHRGKRSKIFTAVVATALVLTAAGCSRPATADKTTTSSSGASTAEIRIGVGIDASYAPFYLADKQGLFTAAGLKVKLVQFGGGGLAVEALNAGQLQVVGASDTTTVSQLQANPNLRALFSYQTSGKYIKVVLRNGVSSPKEIKNFGIVPGLSQLLAVNYLQSQSIDTAGVKMVTATPTDMPTLMKRGDIDAFVLWEPWPTQAVTQAVGKVITTTGEYGWNYAQWFVTSKTWLTGNEATAAKIATVLESATQKVESDPAAAATATKESVKLPEAQTLTAVDEIDFAVKDLTPADITADDRVADFFVQSGTLKSKPDLSTVMLTGWLSANKA